MNGSNAAKYHAGLPTLYFMIFILLTAHSYCYCAEKKPVPAPSQVNIKDFSKYAVKGDWSAAIQKAIDSVTAKNGYEQGTTIYFPPGKYKINKTIKLGKDAAHYGMHLSGYGAVLVGSKILDNQPLDYEKRKKLLTEKKDEFSLTALPGELDFNNKNVGIAILELWEPPKHEGASFVIEGLTFDREVSGVGVGIKIPAETVPKNITFRDIKVHGQNVGVHINHCYQIRFESCIIRGNQIGIWGRNHFNSVSITNSSIRRQHLHGLIIGPNASEWGSSGINISGCIFEEIKGYGILNAGGNEVTIIGNYFEMVGNSIGVLSRFGNTTIDTNVFLSFYGYGWNMNQHRKQLVSDQAHIVLDSPGVQLRNNRYYGTPIMVFDLKDKNTLDSMPLAAANSVLKDGMKAGDSSGLGAYVYYEDLDQFEYKEFAVPTARSIEDTALLEKVRDARRTLKAIEAGTPDDYVGAQLAIGNLWLGAGEYERARADYEKARQYAAADQTHLRGYIEMHIADSYMQEKKYTEAAASYAKALEIGAGGWHKTHCEENLKKAKEMATAQP